MIENQATVCAWATETFGKRTFASAHRRMMIEINELQKLLPDPGVEALIVLEMADVVITMYAVAEAAHLDLHEVMNGKMAVNRRRKWLLHGDGTGQHIGDDR